MSTQTKMTPAAASNSQTFTKRGLRIDKECCVNLENVCAFLVYKESIHLQLADQNIIEIHLEESRGSLISAHPSVKINEFKRIERELNEYFQL